MDPTSTKSLGPKRLRALRLASGLTQAQAEEWWVGHTGSHGRTWRRYERGETPIPHALKRLVASGALRLHTPRTG